jgi:signal transduction histidine kinase
MLVDNMAHEMRTPLTCIRGYGEILEKANVSEDQRLMAAKYVTSESKRLQKISQVLLDSAYIRENALKEQRVFVNLLLSDTAYSLQPLAEKAGVSIKLEDDLQKTVMGDHTLLSMLAYNLTENAVKACQKGGTVMLRTTNLGFEVQDNGRGIEEEKIAHLTSPFYRTDKSRSRADGGAGLGLHLCKMIADSHGARLEIESRLSKGTTVRIIF